MATDEIINKSVREAENPFLIQKKPKKKKKAPNPYWGNLACATAMESFGISAPTKETRMMRFPRTENTLHDCYRKINRFWCIQVNSDRQRNAHC